MSDRKQLAHEDAAEPTVLIAPRPKRAWRCDECSTKNRPTDLNCGYCGVGRDGADG